MKATIGERTFALTKSPLKHGLPKRAATVEVTVNGQPQTARVTTNRAWCGDASKTLSYIWVEVAGTCFYLTLGYGEAADGFKGSEIQVSEGSGPKPEARVTVGDKATQREADRIAGFKRTWLANQAKEASPE